MNLTPTQAAHHHHSLLPLEVWSVYNDPAKQAEYNLARFQLTQEANKEQLNQEVAQALATLLFAALFLTVLIAGVSELVAR